ncbi:uncharacterized protein C7orf26 homolog isoform X2 [Sitophilus oryzae]|nr:uncharacterized protein C7orf26 homolog isoform X2 [Sitophilus oryzae]
MDLSLDLMAEFVFWESDRRGNKRSHALSPLVELELLQILFEYLNSISNEATRNTLFLNLFSPITANIRLGILSKLVSLAVGIPSANILMCASTWMQQLGNTSASSCKLAEALVFDYIHLSSNPEERLKDLSKIAPQFVANFLTAVAENYFISKKEPKYPPDALLRCITNWVSEDSNLCIAAQQRQGILPPGAIAMEATTPIAGLLRWCVLAPLNHQDQEIYSMLYLALLNSISAIPRSNPPRAINVQHLFGIVSALIIYHKEIRSRDESKMNVFLNDPAMQVALDRFSQAVQIALSVNAIYGHIDELFNSLQSLPFNKLLSIVLNKYKESKAPIIIV